jgi:FixJ family two-component response regulator
LDVKTAADDAGISERMGWKLLHQVKEMSHLVQVENREVGVSKTLPLLLPYLTDRERQWLLDIATFKAAKALAEHWGVEYDAARQRKSRLLRKVTVLEKGGSMNAEATIAERLTKVETDIAELTRQLGLVPTSAEARNIQITNSILNEEPKH